MRLHPVFRAGLAVLTTFAVPCHTLNFRPTLLTSVASDQSAPLGNLMQSYQDRKATEPLQSFREQRRPKRPSAQNNGAQTHYFKADEALDRGEGEEQYLLKDPVHQFAGLRNQDNMDLLGFYTSPADPSGAAGKDFFVQAINVAFGVYDKRNGTLVGGPYPIGALWQDFPLQDCGDDNGDPIVLYDRFEERWLISQFTFGCDFPDQSCFTCLAVSQTDNPTGSYNRYAFPAQEDPTTSSSAFPDYPKWGVWGDYYILTTRDFYGGLDAFLGFGVSVYAIEKQPMILGNKNTRAQRYTLVGNEQGFPNPNVDAFLFGDILLPPNADGNHPPATGLAAPLLGTTDNDVVFTEPWTPFDAMNIWELTVDWSTNSGSLRYSSMLPVSPYTSSLLCGDTFGCVPQPGVGPDSYLEALSTYLMHRLAYRNHGDYESMVVCQSVQVAETGGAFGTFGVRWYEIRRKDKAYSIYQQGTFAPPDGVSRWMGSIAQDRKGNIAMGYSVSDAVSTFPGIRIAGRLANDPLNFMTLGEATIIDGGASQLNTGDRNRWGDYSAMSLDPDDDCTFWYTSMYYSKEGVRGVGRCTSDECWETRIASFMLPGCIDEDKKVKTRKGD